MANGIPPLLNQVNDGVDLAILLVADAVNIASMFAPPVWGVYLDNAIAIDADSFVGMEYDGDWRVPNYTQEQGAFQSYNKVRMPFSVMVTLSKGGSEADRNAFIVQTAAAAESINLYDVVTPEFVYASASIVRVGYRRIARNGAHFILADLHFEQIRITATQAFSNTKAPSGANAVQTGTVQPQTPSQAQGALAASAT